jgi:hypothetical protein
MENEKYSKYRQTFGALYNAIENPRPKLIKQKSGVPI